MSAPSAILLKQSAAYKAYVALGRLPAEALLWDLNEDGSPQLRTGELYCRMPDPERGICGQACVGTTPLKEHVKAMHDTTAADTGVKGNIGGKKLGELRDFYVNLMANEAYDKETGELQSANSSNAVGKGKKGKARAKKVGRDAITKSASKGVQRKALGKRKFKVTTYIEVE